MPSDPVLSGGLLDDGVAGVGLEGGFAEGEFGDPEDFFDGDGFAGERWAIEFVEDQDGTARHPGQDQTEDIAGWAVDIHVEVGVGDDEFRVACEVIGEGEACIAGDDFEIGAWAERAAEFVGVEEGFEILLPAGSDGIIADLHGVAILGIGGLEAFLEGGEGEDATGGVPGFVDLFEEEEGVEGGAPL